MTVRITRQDVTVQMLREASAAAKASNTARRMLAVARVMEGCSREEAARSCGMDRQTLRDWIHRFNEAGLAGLSDKPHGGGPAARLTQEQEAAVKGWVEQGPDVATDGVVRWRRADLAKRIERAFAVRLAECSVGRLLRRLGFSRISVRPRHPKADVAAQEAHKKTSPSWSLPSSRLRHKASRSSCGGRTKRASASKAA